jgi:hypothetical protein
MNDDDLTSIADAVIRERVAVSIRGLLVYAALQYLIRDYAEMARAIRAIHLLRRHQNLVPMSNAEVIRQGRGMLKRMLDAVR